MVYDAAIKSHFGVGLRDDISKVILGAANLPQTVADMLTAVEAVEAETSIMGPPGAYALAVASIDPSDGSYEETLSGLDAKAEELMAAISRFRSRPFKKTKILCYNCNKYGHFKNECKEPLRVAPTTGNRTAGAPQPRCRQSNWRSQNAVEDQPPEEEATEPHQEDEVAGNFGYRVKSQHSHYTDRPVCGVFKDSPAEQAYRVKSKCQ